MFCRNLKKLKIYGSRTLVRKRFQMIFIIIIIIFSPWRIVDDCGGAFALGAIGGTLFHSIKGFRHAPSVKFPFNFFFVLIKKMFFFRVNTDD